jgi:hypothetical protein
LHFTPDAMRDDDRIDFDGPNAALVNEVIAFARGDGVFAGVADLGRCRYPVRLVADMRRAVDAAGGVGRIGRFRVAAEEHRRLTNCALGDEGGSECIWYDLQSILVARQIWTTEYYAWRKVHSAAVGVIRSMGTGDPERVAFRAILRDRLPEGPAGPDGTRGYYRQYVVEQAESDLIHCAENRAFNGPNDNHWERLFEAYRAGVWPCGWQGAWPSGRLLVWQALGSGTDNMFSSVLQWLRRRPAC